MAIDIISKLKPKNKGKFALMDACDIAVDENDTRLDKKLEELAKNAGGGGGGGSSIAIDKTLSQEGQAADAKAVGDRITTTLGNIETVLKIL